MEQRYEISEQEKESLKAQLQSKVEEVNGYKEIVEELESTIEDQGGHMMELEQEVEEFLRMREEMQ